MHGSREGAGRPSRPGWRGDISTLATFAGLVALVLLWASAALLLVNVARLRAAQQDNLAAAEIADLARDLQTSVVTAESAQRGYLLTGEDRYLAPHGDAARQAAAQLAQLEARVAIPDQRARLARLRPLVDAKLTELEETLRLYRTGPQDALELVRTDEGQRLIEQIRAEVSAFEEREFEVLEERGALVAARSGDVTYLAMGCGALSMLAAGLSALGILRRRDARMLEERAGMLEREVALRTARLEAANEELEAYAAAISHDLRTPVRAIGGLADALQEEAAPRLEAEERDWLDRIAAASERLDALIGAILRYSRLAQQDLELAPVELETAVDAALDHQLGRVRESGAVVTVDRPLPQVLGDAAALAQAVENLVANALKFHAPGRAPEVRIRAERRPGGMVRLWVEDRGIGIPPAQRARIFRPFERLHGREAYPGTGVGLAIVRRVAERLGGACGLEAAPEGGSRFWIELRGVETPGAARQGRAQHAGA